VPITLASWNVNGIRAILKKDCFTPFMDEVQPDVICMQEVKAEAHESGLEVPGFTPYWHAADRKGYSGTAVLSKLEVLKVSTNLPTRLANKHELSSDPYGNPNTEGRVITVEYPDFYLVTVYTPNAKDDLSRLALRHERWDPAFTAHLKALAKKKPVAICGDLNVAHKEIDLANPKTNKGNAGFTDEERAGFDGLLDAGFVDTFRMFNQDPGHYSWWSYRGGARANNKGWRIDYFLVSEDLAPAVIAAQIHPDVLGSDHCPVSRTLDL